MPTSMRARWPSSKAKRSAGTAGDGSGDSIMEQEANGDPLLRLTFEG